MRCGGIATTLRLPLCAFGSRLRCCDRCTELLLLLGPLGLLLYWLFQALLLLLGLLLYWLFQALLLPPRGHGWHHLIPWAQPLCGWQCTLCSCSWQKWSRQLLGALLGVAAAPHLQCHMHAVWCR
jgi:hypothetical protein